MVSLSVPGLQSPALVELILDDDLIIIVVKNIDPTIVLEDVGLHHFGQCATVRSRISNSSFKGRGIEEWLDVFSSGFDFIFERTSLDS
jgi:hypothetical protein